MMTKEKYPSIFLKSIGRYCFIILQIFFEIRGAVLQTEEYVTIIP